MCHVRFTGTLAFMTVAELIFVPQPNQRALLSLLDLSLEATLFPRSRPSLDIEVGKGLARPVLGWLPSRAYLGMAGPGLARPVLV